MQSLLYIISAITVFILAILIKKSEEKLEIVKTIVIIAGLHLAYNTLICYILNLVNISITLISLAITNYIIAGIMLFIISRNRQLQKYYISKTNILMAVLCVLIATIVIGINFNCLTKIRYVSMDSREHYMVAREFSENNCLANKANQNNSHKGGFMPGAYTNVGILFNVFEPFAGTINLFKIFILFEAVVFVYIGFMFYAIISKHIKTNVERIITIVFTILYLIGYPLNAWISGFHYLLLGILYIELIIFFLDNKELKIDNTLILFLLNFGLILSYSLFCPFIYLSEFMYIIIRNVKRIKQSKNKKVDILKILIHLFIVFIIPGIIGVTYIILPSNSRLIGSIAHEGWLYKNLWSNFILFIPFSIYNLYKEYKKGKIINYKNILLLFLLLFMGILFVGTKTGKISEYYFYKNYYIIWIVLLLNSTKGLITFINEEKEKYITIIYTIVYVLIFTIMVLTQTMYLQNDNYDSFDQTMQIYVFNKTMMNTHMSFLSKEDIKILNEAQKYVEWKEDNFYIVADQKTQGWIRALTGYNKPLYENTKERLKQIENDKIEYLIIFKKSLIFNNIKSSVDLEKYNIMYEDNLGEILKIKD